MRFIIVDLDGTIADIRHRLYHIKGTFKKNWDAFFAACVDDAPIKDVISLVHSAARSGAMILYVSGRSDVVRTETEAWLNKHKLPFGRLFMRKAGDHRPDYIVKEEILDQELRVTPEEVWFVLDDRDQVVDMWRRRGFRVLQVADGDF